MCMYHLKWHTVTAFVSVPRHIIIYMYAISVINGLWVYLIYRLGNLALSCSKLPKIKDAWTVQFECMHGVVGPRSLVEGQHVWS